MGEKLSGCDNHMIRFNIRAEQNLANKMSTVQDYRLASFNHVRGLLRERLDSISVDNVWNNFRGKLLEVERTTVSTKIRRVNGAV